MSVLVKNSNTSNAINDRYIITIGASAGGLEAIHEFFDHMPPNSGFTFVVIQHLSPDYKSLLVELVSKHTHMKVREAGNDMLLEQNCVYIIPSKKTMTIRHRKLRLADKVKDRTPNNAIDTFLLTLANDVKEKAIAIILSGTGTDGSKGIDAIKECGGMVIAQDPTTAKFDGMPNSAIATGNTDFVLPPAKMHTEIYNYVNHSYVPDLEKELRDDEHLTEIFDIVSQQTGQDFNLYKTPTILRRIARRLAAADVHNLNDYLQYIQDKPAEAKILAKEFLIGVTKFFRDKAAFEKLQQHVIPEIVASKTEGQTIKVWICACSTGEEAYSIAILFHEVLKNNDLDLELKIFATDLDEESIRIASKNCYPASSVKEVESGILKKYFTKNSDGTFSIIPEVRKRVVFAAHNVIKSPPFIKNDLISCRNMLIYMNSILQQKILTTFHYSLVPNGYLFLGSSENATSIMEGLREVSGKLKIYQRTGNIKFNLHHTYTTAALPVPAAPKKLPVKDADPKRTTAEEFQALMTGQMGYVGVFIDKGFVIKETLGEFSKYLALPKKKLELNLLNMVNKDISILLSTSIRRAWKDNEVMAVTGTLDGNRILQMTIKPPDDLSPNDYTLVLLNELLVDAPVKSVEAADIDHLSSQDEYLMEMENALTETRSNLQLAVEEMETTNEELQSSNEELMSANEELQSGNEELQSLNEELHTLNTEHQQKIRELTELNEDLDNYFRSTSIGQIFIDSNLLIRKFNPAAINMVNMIESDIGRPINHLSNNIKYNNLDHDIHTVLANDTVIEKEVTLNNGTNNLMRIMPYLKKGGKIDGVVITFIDITDITRLNNMIAGVYNASSAAILAFGAVTDKNGTVISYSCISHNHAAQELFQKTAEYFLKQPGLDEFGQLSKVINSGNIQRILDADQPYQTELQVTEGQWHQLVVGKMIDGFVLSFNDITKRKIAEQKLKNNYGELVKARESLRLLNTGLEEKVRERTKELSQSEERFKFISQATNDTIWDWNLFTNTMWRSDNFKNMFGYEISDDITSIDHWFNSIHPDDRQRVENGIFEAINGHQPNWSAEYRFRRADGSYAIVLDRGSILQDELETPYRLVGSIIDISKLVETEKRLNSSERKFQKVFESNMIGMIFAGLDGHIIEANDAFLNMLGYSRQELELGELDWKKLTPEKYFEVSDKAVQQLKQEKVCPPFEKQYIKRDGTLVSVLMGSILLEEEDQSTAVSYIIDITNQKEAEQKRAELQTRLNRQQEEFTNIFSNAPALIAIKRGPNLAYDFVNEAYSSFFGPEHHIGNTTSLALTTSKMPFGNLEREVFSTGKIYQGKQIEVSRDKNAGHNPGKCWIDITITPVYSYDGEHIDGVAFFGYEVTDIVLGKLATEELMNRKDEFMSIASHELKTPITSMKGSLQIVQRMIAKMETNETLSRFIDKATHQTQKLTTLIDDLLNVTRIQEGKVVLNYQEFNAVEMLKDCIDDVKAPGINHKLILHAKDDVIINADRPRIEQVVHNFLTNAIKYSPGADTVVVYCSVDENMFKVEVKDFGIGIPEEKLPYIFDRFYRVQESSAQFSGLGLGLYISSEIVKRHHGEVGVDSVAGEGSTFWFKLPLKK
ncbi:chemotaxis protein CheB [Mucilaginibacter terrae]|uniref:Two-component system CheB/CheR fusion protein n=1 Tax=Mucilaginibacter terrae TaxID=1955052 RepID=A0ABU3GRV9_9SPHI|nr:chemotaxis protein CheB [Mucilaginibacter terrae]MDT3401375.1 two-component system CheB/CheR fusion protein [Mucilaginibacter terrae]